MSAMTRIAHKAATVVRSGTRRMDGAVVLTVFTGACGREAARGATAAARADTAGARRHHGGAEDTTARWSSGGSAPPRRPRPHSSRRPSASTGRRSWRSSGARASRSCVEGFGEWTASTPPTLQRRPRSSTRSSSIRRERPRRSRSGATDWPLPIPIVKEDGTLALRCRGRRARGSAPSHRRKRARCHRGVPRLRRGAARRTPRRGTMASLVNQYAQRIISTPGKQDGLAWRSRRRQLAGPVGEAIARVIAEGYTDRSEPSMATTSRC